MPLSKLFPCFQFRLNDNINKLDYSNNIFSDGFPQVWQYERTLEELNVTSTRINNLPPQLFYCQGLRVLLANNNSLENIPEAVGSLRQLQKLNLSRNFISDVPDNIKSCKNLTHLDLSCNALQKLPDAITYLISLQELILNETFLEYLPANFGRLVNLRIVELRSNNLISLPKSMQRLTNLQRLDIGCNEFTKMPEVIGELKQLRELWFDFNQIENLPLHIGKLRDLVHCEADGNCLTCLPSEIGNWRSLEVLSVSINNLTNIPLNFGMLKSLVVLKCESNDLEDLPSSISNLENLEELVVSHNKLIRLPNTIGMLRKLRHLFADDNNLQTLPDEICSCSLLSVLSVSQNKISSLPINIGHLTNLKVLNIVQNNIATLPVTILSLRNLTSLWISNNQSQPLIPLQYTDIGKTQLTCFMLPQQKRNDILDDVKKTFEIKQLSDKASICAISKRRICFAEETTVLHSNTQRQQLILPTSKSSTSNNDGLLSNLNTTKLLISTSYDSTEQKGENENLLSVNNCQDFLMRSPTPYPKDLRLMAKYVQNSHRKILNSYKNENEVNINEDNRSENSWTSDNKKLNLKSRIKDNYANLQTCLQQQRIDNVENNQEKQIQIEPITNAGEHIFKANSSIEPPPYHIARCFTKKSAEDLTKYELLRKHQEQHDQHFHINTENNQLYLRSYNSQNLELVNKPEVKIDFQNNLMIKQTEQQDKLTELNSNWERTGSSNTLNKNQKSNIEYFGTPQTSNIYTNRSKTKWLFGAHRNPRVIQVNISSESGRDFQIDVLPNRDGIYIVSTVSESYVSKLLHPSDKLLEVDGVDCTNISVNEARQILNNCKPTISIMLSRK